MNLFILYGEVKTLNVQGLICCCMICSLIITLLLINIHNYDVL